MIAKDKKILMVTLGFWFAVYHFQYYLCCNYYCYMRLFFCVQHAKKDFAFLTKLIYKSPTIISI